MTKVSDTEQENIVPISIVTPTATVQDVASFRGGSAGGLGGLSPQHYKDTALL
ncbi:hypothetical protein JYU34_000199 [Plutella xylostella]|uniref:Uncharacterized protein n=1 Tax=Plutella xylostella TaxID=51655 RepID=A0ABQ7R740_PLUXY|nr:hypothetical protein JYU34_000199 [Plutella xylostella]